MFWIPLVASVAGQLLAGAASANDWNGSSAGVSQLASTLGNVISSIGVGSRLGSSARPDYSKSALDSVMRWR